VRKNKPAPFAFFLKERLLEVGDRRALNLVLSNLMEVLRQRREKIGSQAGSSVGTAAKGVNISLPGSSFPKTLVQAPETGPKLSRNQKRKLRRQNARLMREFPATPRFVSVDVPTVKAESISQRILAFLK
jgi:hypothetical protein